MWILEEYEKFWPKYVDDTYNFFKNAYPKGNTMTDRFDLEEEIMNCWSVVEDMKVSQDPEYILALAVVYQAKFEHLFETFEQVVSKRVI